MERENSPGDTGLGLEDWLLQNKAWRLSSFSAGSLYHGEGLCRVNCPLHDISYPWPLTTKRQQHSPPPTNKNSPTFLNGL